MKSPDSTIVVHKWRNFLSSHKEVQPYLLRGMQGGSEMVSKRKMYWQLYVSGASLQCHARILMKPIYSTSYLRKVLTKEGISSLGLLSG